jgi:hypothetical protein
LKAILLILIGLFFTTSILKAQSTMLQDEKVITEGEKITKHPVIDSSKERDLSDVYFNLIRKNSNFTKDREEDAHKMHFSLVPAAGYTLQTGFAAILSANWGFSLDTVALQKVSSITTSFTYSQYNQSIVPFVANIWTKGNKLNIISDNRYIKYPSEVWGLAGRTDPNQGYTIDFSGLKLHETVMKEVSKNIFLGIGYYYDQFWNIEALDSVKQNVIRRLTNKVGTSELASGMVLRFLYDSRINQIYPEQGWHVDVNYRVNTTLLGSDQNWQIVQTDIRTYSHFPANSRNILSFWNFDWFTLGPTSPPYLMMPSTGWDDQYNTGRGYIQGRYRGRSMYYFESEYRFRISHNGLLGGVAFANAQYFPNEIATRQNILVPGFGGGIRLRLNKHSNANLCLDYGIGLNGSQGFFVNLGEVF